MNTRLKGPSPAGQRGELGFTLIELMVTVSILAIATTVAVPAFGKMISNNRAEAVSNELYALLQYARTTAAIHHLSLSACLEDDSWTLKMGCDSAEVLRSVRLPEGVTVASGADHIDFRYNGTAAGTRLTICGNDDARNCFTLDVANTGYIRRHARGTQDRDGSAMNSCNPS